jgi:hypothetical protein
MSLEDRIDPDGNPAAAPLKTLAGKESGSVSDEGNRIANPPDPEGAPNYPLA